MNNIQFLLADTSGILQLCPPPDNWRDLQIELSFEALSPDTTLNATELEWKGLAARNYLTPWININGIGEGIGFQIQICNTNAIVFDGICDLSDPDTKFHSGYNSSGSISYDMVKTKIRDKRNDMLNQLLPSISFAYLATPQVGSSLGQGAGIINPTLYQDGGDYIPVLYQNNQIPDYLAVMLSVTSIAAIVNAFISIANAVEAIANILTSFIAGVVTVAGAIAAAGLCILQILNILIQIVIIVELLEQIYLNLISPVYTKLGMNVWTLFNRICQYLGFEFSSSISTQPEYENLVYLPAKNAWANQNADDNLSISGLFNDIIGGSIGTLHRDRLSYDDSYNLLNGGFAYGYPDENPMSFIKGMEEAFNAETKIIELPSGAKQLSFERWDFQQIGPYYTLPNISEEAPFEQPHKTNFSELASNYQVLWSQDSTDYNTYFNYDGTSCYCQTSVNHIVVTQSHVVLQNLVTRQIPYAQGVVKKQDTAIEHIFSDIFSIVTDETNIIQSIIYDFSLIASAGTYGVKVKPGSNVTSDPTSYFPTGCLYLSSNCTGVPKLLNVDMSSGTTITTLFGNGSFGYQLSQTTRSQGDMLTDGGDPLSATNLMKYFHWSSLPYYMTPPITSYALPYTPNTVWGNQWYKYDNQEIPMYCGDFNILQNNNVIYTYDGKLARMDSLKWTLLKSLATTDYRVWNLYNTNLNYVFTVDGIGTYLSLNNPSLSPQWVN